MGRDKASCVYQGRPFAEHLEELLALAGCQWVSRSVAKASLQGPHELVDIVAGLGPLGGWLTAATRFPDYRVVSVPVDMPALSVGDLESLVLTPVSGWLCAGQTHHWLLACLDPPDLQALAGYLAGPDHSARGFWATRPAAQPLEFPSNRRFINVNSPADLESLNGV
jgi:molybdopterin-guanine dinucleotide biosynthesis protein A